MGKRIEFVARTQVGVQGATPLKDIIEGLLCVIDILVGGNGSDVDLRDGTSQLYAERHLYPMGATKGIKTFLVNGYIYLDLGQYGSSQRRIRVPMHRIMCGLRWGNPSFVKACACHDIECVRRDCVGLGCLRWATAAANARDRVRKAALRRARQGRAAPGVARASACMSLTPKSCVVRVHAHCCCLWPI